MTERLSHLNARGEAHMVDVGDKAVTTREAWASGQVRMQPATLALLADNALPKGDVLATARIAAIQAAKRTSDLIPLCHLLPLSSVKVEFSLDEQLPGVRIRVRCRVEGRTGVEMEALTAASVAGLTLYDMCKAVDKGMVIEAVQLEHKSGGKSGDWNRPQHQAAEQATAAAGTDTDAGAKDAIAHPIRVLFFASLREELGEDFVEIDAETLDTPTIAGVAALLMARSPRYAVLGKGKVLSALNQQMVKQDVSVRAGDEVGFFPPVTGG